MSEKPESPTSKSVDVTAEKPNGKVPTTALSMAKKLDHIILRLNKLIASPGGLSSFLSTLNYTLYLLAHLQTTHSHHITRHYRSLLVLLNSAKSPPSATVLVTDTAAVPPIAALAGQISKARTTLRLFGLFPLYAWLRTLLKGKPDGADPVLHNVALLQCLSYVVYQALENIAFLGDNGVLSPTFIARLNKGDSTTGRLYLWAYRAWLAGVGCDFLRLAREAQTLKQTREARGGVVTAEEEEQDNKTDAKWWGDFVVAAAWFPMAFHYSSTTGIPGWNLGWMGVSGLVAGFSRTQGLWRATLHP